MVGDLSQRLYSVYRAEQPSTIWNPTHSAYPLLMRSSQEERLSYEADQMLGSGEVIGKLQVSWDELLNHVLPFSDVRGVHPSLALKVIIVHACDNQNDALCDFLVDCRLTLETDAGDARFARYVIRTSVSHLNHAVRHFQLALDPCPVSHPDHTTALANLAHTRLQGYIRNHLQDIDSTTSFLLGCLYVAFAAPSRSSLISIAIHWLARNEAPISCSPGHPRRDTTLNNLALAFNTTLNNLALALEGLNEAIDRYRESHRFKIQGAIRLFSG
ncbi:hypothetical protein BD769DRAFT_1675304 [Suillus cothurnatus]|nr:hypothetical protein BD769DRAFT_1675304 [Suillus cothurnatus]